ncbi:hypothetical protein KAH37_08150, partial [bacterium]|nr:hypothetical protein [bacterium]
MNQSMDIKKKSNQIPLSTKKRGGRKALPLLAGLLLLLIACSKTVDTIDNDSDVSLMDEDVVSDQDITESPFECKQTETVIDNEYLTLNKCTTIQWGSPEYDGAHSLLYIENELFISSTTRGMVGDRRYGFYDFVLEKYNITEQKWNDNPLQWGTPYADLALTMNFDGEFLFFSGLTDGDLNGNLNQDATHDTSDFFVSKATLGGDILWTTQFGGKNLDRIGDTIYDKEANEIIICGNVYENYPEYEEEDMTDMAIFIVDANDGTVKNHILLGSDRLDFAMSISLASNKDIIVAGSSSSIFSERDGAFGFSDAVIALVTKEGDVLWKRQFGTEKADTFIAITSDTEGSIYA